MISVGIRKANSQIAKNVEGELLHFLDIFARGASIWKRFDEQIERSILVSAVH